MKIHAFTLAFCIAVGAAAGARAQTAPAMPDPLADLQGDFGAVVGEAFHRPDPIVAAVGTPGSPALALGGALRTSMQIPGAVFAGVLQPFADAEKTAAPAPVPAAPQSRRAARVHHHRAAVQG